MFKDLHSPSEEEYLNCIRCGLCLSVCPTYREALSETASPRGRVALARKTFEGQLQLTPNLSEQMNTCLACMACNDACPVGIRPSDLTLYMRQAEEKQRPSAWKQALFGGLLAKPWRLAHHATLSPTKWPASPSASTMRIDPGAVSLTTP